MDFCRGRHYWDRLVMTVSATTGTTTQAYDLDNAVTSTTDADGRVTDFGYDYDGRVTEET